MARCTDSDIAVTTMHTDVGQLIGTLAYMSPEQCDGDPLGIDTRSDVYSLGVVLYELLCGKLPYEITTRSIPKATRTICEEPPVRPSTIDRKLRGDLEILALKALEKEREKRYASVEALAGDIRRYLRGEPIEARGATAWSQVLKWAARHPVAASTTASVVLAIGVLCGTFAIGYYLTYVRPDHIELYEDAHAAKLMTLGGQRLHEWPRPSTPGLKAVANALVVDEPPSLGGRRLAVVGYAVLAAPFYGALCAFDFSGDWNTPLWARKIEKDALPHDLVDADPARLGFNVYSVLAADVFPEGQSPGDELICTHSHIFSRRCLRIYSLGGEVLYQSWQDGSIAEMFWMPSSGTLVCLALDERVKKKYEESGLTTTTGHVLFALKPFFGLRSREYIEESANDQVRPVWYKYLQPARTVDESGRGTMSVCLTRDIGEYDPTRYVGLNITAKGPNGREGTLAFVIDEDGIEIRESRYLGDSWNSNRDVLPNPDEFYLSDNPPTPAPTTQPRGASD